MTSAILAAFLASHSITPSPAPSLPADAVIMCSFVVNEQPHGEVLVAFSEEDVWIEPAGLTRAGLQWTGVLDKIIDGESLVSLSSVHPALTFEFDERNVTLRISAPAAAFAAQTIQFASAPLEPVLRPRHNSFFVNYAATFADGHRPIYAGEIGLRAAGGLLRSTLARGVNGALTRGATTVAVDDEMRLVRWEAGDAVLSSGASGATLPIAGLTVSRNLGIDPSFVAFSPLTMSGVAAAPATAEVYVNDQLVSRTPVAPGVFELRNLSVPSGAGSARVVIRDHFGRTEEITRSFYRAPNVLRRGLHQFRYGVGALRTNASSRLFEYRGVTGFGQHRVGITDSLTIGATAQAAKEMSGGGVEVALRTLAGEVELQGFGTRTRIGSGTALLTGYAYRGARFGAGMSVRMLSRDFEELGMDRESARPRVDWQAYVNMIVAGGNSVSVQHTTLRDWQKGHLERTSVSTGVRLSSRLQLLVAASSSFDGTRRTRAVVASMSVPLGRRGSAAASYDARSDGPGRVNLEVQRSLPLGPGVGYRLHWQDRPIAASAGVVDVQNQAGRVQLRRDVVGSSATNSVNLAGSVVAIGGAIQAARPVDDAFALVRVSDVPGVRTYLSNQLVGRTNRRGEVLVPSLVSYYANRIAIDDRDVPLTHEVGLKELLVAPALRGGALLPFPVRRMRNITGRFLLRSPDEIAPQYGDAEAQWGEGAEHIALGPGGEFFFERATSGMHEVRVSYLGLRYVCILRVGPAQSAPAVEDLGPVSCASEANADAGTR
jgi:outer membrane usher protein